MNNTVCEQNMCAGCMACVDVCPKHAVTVLDSLVAYNAIIDSDLCISCNACHKICQAIIQPAFRPPILWKQGWACDYTLREKSSSGGLATALGISFIESGGVVYCCTFENGEFIFKRANTAQELYQRTGSKYVKSIPKEVYKKIKQTLKDEIKVLFIGLPCQVAALLNFCGNNQNLYTIDLICHGSPSPKLLSLFLRENDIDINKIQHISFRNKGQFILKSNNTRLSPPEIGDYYTATFLNGTTYTENCYFCKYARKERVSDLTLGDSWGSTLSIEEQSKGISLLLVQTEKGIQLIKSADIELLDVFVDTAISNNHQLQHPMLKNPQRDKFFIVLEKSGIFRKAYAKSFPKQYRKDIIKKIMIMLHINWIIYNNKKTGGAKK